MVIGENVVPMQRLRTAGAPGRTLIDRIRAYADRCRPTGSGGVVVQQSTEDADAEVWNLVYSDPFATRLLASGRLAFELKVGQGAKPGLGGMTVLTTSAAAAVATSTRWTPPSATTGGVLRSSSPGTFTEEILRQQVQLMRNNYPRARVWVKLHPGRDVGQAAQVAWSAGADAVTVDGAEGGTGWAPSVFLDQVGLPLASACAGSASTTPSLLASGRIWEGSRAREVPGDGRVRGGPGPGRAARGRRGSRRGTGPACRCLELELRLLLSALGKYRPAEVSVDDLWFPNSAERERDQL